MSYTVFWPIRIIDSDGLITSWRSEKTFPALVDARVLALDLSERHDRVTIVDNETGRVETWNSEGVIGGFIR